MHANAVLLVWLAIMVATCCGLAQADPTSRFAEARKQMQGGYQETKSESNTIKDLPEKAETMLEKLVALYTEFTSYGDVSKNIHEFEEKILNRLHTVNNATFHKMVVSAVIGFAAYAGSGIIPGAAAFVIGSYYITETRIKSVSAILFAFAAYNLACAFKRKGGHYRNIGFIALLLGFLSYYNIL